MQAIGRVAITGGTHVENKIVYRYHELFMKTWSVRAVNNMIGPNSERFLFTRTRRFSWIGLNRCYAESRSNHTLKSASLDGLNTSLRVQGFDGMTTQVTTLKTMRRRWWRGGLAEGGRVYIWIMWSSTETHMYYHATIAVCCYTSFHKIERVAGKGIFVERYCGAWICLALDRQS